MMDNTTESDSGCSAFRSTAGCSTGFEHLCFDIESVQSVEAQPAAFHVLAGSDSRHDKNSSGRSVASTRSAKSTKASKGKNRDQTDPDTDLDSVSGGIAATVIMISGCEDRDTSADVSNVSSFSLPNPNGKAGGACTSALLNVLYSSQQSSSKLTFVQVLSRMRGILRAGKFSQVPQLTSSQPMNVNQPFYLVPPECAGTRRAVLIGINYVGQAGELSGCHNDCLNMKDYITSVYGFDEKDITVLMDDGKHTNPTRANILNAYKDVVASTAPGDAVFCHYSGHGGYLRDDDWGEEVDGYDETLVPVDFASNGQIRDDDLYTTLVTALPEESTLISLMDCCHSATVLDLPYKYKANAFGGVSTVGPDIPSNSGLSSGRTGSRLVIMIGIALLVLSFLFYMITNM